jgi:ADP-heptose:LPS heptosyltransferase
VGASSALKLWQPEKWRQVARWLEERSLQVAWSAGCGESAIVKLIDPHGRHESYAERLDLAQMWRLIANASIFISPDTGVAHLARLTGAPSVTLFGPGSAWLFWRGHFWRDMPCAEVTVEDFPCRDQHEVFCRDRPWIQHCRRSPSQCDGARCMSAIDTTVVVEAAGRLLDGDRTRPRS